MRTRGADSRAVPSFLKGRPLTARGAAETDHGPRPARGQACADADHRTPQPVLRRQPHPARRLARGARSGLHGAAGPQRRRQDHAAEDDHGPGRCAQRRIAIRRSGHSAPAAVSARARRHRLRAAGPRDLQPADGRGEPDDGSRPAVGRRRTRCARAHLRTVPGAEADAEASRRRPVGRAAAAACDRARAGGRPEAADPRRADRRHPAVDHQGNRRGRSANW